MQLPRAQRWLFTLLSATLCIILAAKLLFPIFVDAQTPPPATGTPTAPVPAGGTCDPRVGPELARFDKGGQEDIYQKVVVKQGFKGPVQVINMVTENPYNPAPGNPVVLRIAGVTKSLSISEITAYAQKLRSLPPGTFPDKTIVFFGNEENNLEIEWKEYAAGDFPTGGAKSSALVTAGRDYAKMFNAFAGAMKGSNFRVAPAPPDLYNGIWSVKDWIQGFNSAVDCSGINVLTANIYNVPNSLGYQPLDVWQYWQKSICSASKPLVHFSGWGEDPNNKAGVQAQIDFLAQHKPPSNIESAATLIVDTCNGLDSNVTKSNWLYYVCTNGEGKVFTPSGHRVKGNCSTDVTTYYEYTLNRPDTNSVLNNFYDEYSVTCLPQTAYKIAMTNREACADHPELCNNWGSSGPLKISAAGKLLGLYRNEAEASQRLAYREPLSDRKESLEGFFAGKTTLSEQEALDRLTNTNISPEDFSAEQAPIYKLSSLTRQCELAKQKMKAVQYLCLPQNKVKVEDDEETIDPEQCAIDEEIPNTTFTHTSLLSEIDNIDCYDLMEPTSDQHRKDLQNAVLEVRYTMEAAYRPAFIVVATKARNEDQPPANTTFQAQQAEPTWTVVDYLEVKVPAFGSDIVDPETYKSASPNTSNPVRSFQDALRLTADAIIPDQIQLKYRTLDAQERMAARNSNPSVSGKVIGENGSSPVKCRKPTATGFTLVDCNDANGPDISLATALVKFINAAPAALGARQASSELPMTDQEKSEVAGAYGFPCEVDFAKFVKDGNLDAYESAGEIGSKLEAKDYYYIASGEGELKVDRKKEAVADVGIKTLSSADGKDRTVHSTTRVFFVSPYGQNLRYSRSTDLALLQADPTKEQIALDSKNFNSLILADLNRELKGNEDKREYTKQVVPDSSVPADPTTPNLPGVRYIKDYITYQMRVLANPEDEPKQPLLWQVAGNVANYPTRLFHLLASSYDSVTNRFTRSCDGKYATEDWFQENCDISKADTNQNIDLSSDSRVCSEKYNVPIQLPTGATSAERLAKVAAMVEAEGKKRNMTQTEINTLWGILEIEGSPYLRAVREGGKTSILCYDANDPEHDLVNSCGAVGPYQIIDGVCTTDSCPSGAKDTLKTYLRQPGEQLCNFDEAVSIAAQKLLASKAVFQGQVSAADLPYAMAGRYGGFTGYGPRCEGAPAVQGCDGANYCDCAVDVFKARFACHLRNAAKTSGLEDCTQY